MRRCKYIKGHNLAAESTRGYKSALQPALVCFVLLFLDEEEVPEDEAEDEDSEIEIKKTGFSLKRILSCLCPWARCFKSRKKHKNKVRPTQSERFNMIFSRVTARNM